MGWAEALGVAMHCLYLDVLFKSLVLCMRCVSEFMSMWSCLLHE
jgi:hypothetical protein